MKIPFSIRPGVLAKAMILANIVAERLAEEGNDKELLEIERQIEILRDEFTECLCLTLEDVKILKEML